MNYKLSYKNGDEMLIGAWVAPAPKIEGYNNANLVNSESYKAVKDSGINTIYALYDKLPDYYQDVTNALNYCEENGLDYLACDKSFSLTCVDLDKSLLKLKNYPSLKGVLFCDEPGEKDFEEIAKAQSKFLSAFSDKMFYVNLLPVYAQKVQFENGATAWRVGDEEGNFNQYRKYIDNYINVVKPEFLSYDYYPMEGKFPSIKAEHFLQLSLINQKAREKQIPFFAFIQCCSWHEKVRNPTEVEIMWQVSTAIAYGAKGIQYFTFLNPLETATEGIQFVGNLMHTSGFKTEKFGWVKEQNIQLKAISKIVLGSEWTGISYKNLSHEISESDRIPLSPQLSISSEILVGNFNYENKNCHYLVNTSLTKKGEAEILAPSTIIKYGTKREKYIGKIILDEGEGVMVLFDNEN